MEGIVAFCIGHSKEEGGEEGGCRDVKVLEFYVIGCNRITRGKFV